MPGGDVVPGGEGAAGRGADCNPVKKNNAPKTTCIIENDLCVPANRDFVFYRRDAEAFD
jgi:hypothetical protein